MPTMMSPVVASEPPVPGFRSHAPIPIAAESASAVMSARRPRPDPSNPTLENNGADVHYETDFRSVYAKVIDKWLGGDSTAVLGGNFRVNGIGFL